MFFDLFLKSFRILLLPFALLFGTGVALRNWLYDRGWLKSAQFGLPVITVGNLSVGGTGKSPMVEYLIRLLHNRYKVATLSRGYKRKTKGYVLAAAHTTAVEIGDEPALFHQKFPHVPVAVGEERLVAIPQLLHDRPDTEVILLDDALQHRSVAAGLNILLTDCSNLYTRDFFLPTGDLRDSRNSSKRAQVIVVTKCPHNLSVAERDHIVAELNPLPKQTVFFTCIDYGAIYHAWTSNITHLEPDAEVLLVTGIANPAPLKKYLEQSVPSYHMQHYNDHHIFTIDDVAEILKRYGAISATKKIILTTEKDAVRLLKFRNNFQGTPVYVIPIEHRFLFEEGPSFDRLVINFIQNFKPPSDHGPKRK